MTEADRIEKANKKTVQYTELVHLNIQAHVAELRALHNLIVGQQKTNDLLEILIDKQNSVCICEPDVF